MAAQKLNRQAQLLIDRYLYEHREDLIDELVQENLLIDGISCEELLTILQNDEQQTLLQIVEIHRGKLSAITIVYWVTFFLSIAHGSHSGWHCVALLM